ncbi:MAG: biotin/lipoyl-binding protein [Oligoflexia bacterium]|nr:biotin/lipoyl-binding protein [Oligoflexia bacterium]
MKEFDFTINGNEYNVRVVSLVDDIVKVEVNGVTYDVEMNKKESKTPVIKRSRVVQTVLERGKFTHKDSGQSLAQVKAPIPGLVLELRCKKGDTVKIGQTVLILEAMKMQNEIQASRDGVIKELKVTEGQNVYEGDVLAVIE